MDRLQQELVLKGVSLIYLETIRGSGAETFYQKCGFSPDASLMVMSKQLSRGDLSPDSTAKL